MHYFKESDKKHTILFPDMAPLHMPLFESILNSEGYNAVYLKEIQAEFAQILNIPAIYDLKISHEKDKITVPIGAPAKIEDGKFILSEQFSR